MKYCLSMWESFLYETWIEPTKKAYALIAASCLCTGSLLILKSFWELYTGTLTAGAADAPAAFFLPGLTETESIRAEFFYSPGCLLLFLQSVCSLLPGRKKKGSVYLYGAVCFY